MRFKLRRSRAVLAAVSLPFLVYLAEAALIDLIRKYLGAEPSGAISRALYLYFTPFTPLVAAVAGFSVLPAAFGRKAFWFALIYIPAMAVLVPAMILIVGLFLFGSRVIP